MACFYGCHQGVQFRDFPIVEAALDRGDQANLIQCLIGFRFLGKVIQIIAQLLFHPGCGIKSAHLVLKEVLHIQ